MVCGGETSATCLIYNPNDDTWSETYSMTHRRTYAAAVKLSSTKWWITGGSPGSGPVRSTEIFTVGEGFSSFVDLPAINAYHNLVTVNSTHVILVGGHSQYTNASLFNIESETWTALPDTLLPVQRVQAGLITHPDGRLEIVVAAGSATNRTQIFSFDTYTWRLGPDFPTGRVYGGSSVPYGDTFLVVGGYVVGGSYQSSIYSYHIETGSWLKMPQELAIARQLSAAFFVPDDYVNCTPNELQ
ncbi:unnamed protein product [Sphagnum tenellum]